MKKNVRNCFDAFKEQSATLLLLLLLCGDLAYIFIHVINSTMLSEHNYMLDLTVDNSYSEFYQYLKFFFIVLLMVRFSLRNEPLKYLVWATVFLYMLIDDSFEIHGNVGGYITNHFFQDLAPQLGLRLEDYGELAASTISGVIFLIVLGWAYWKGSKEFRKISHDLIFLVFIMAFFGVFFDMVHVIIKGSKGVDLLFEIVEDGGEMLAASLILWYTFLTNIRQSNDGPFLWECIRAKLKKLPKNVTQ